MAPPLMVNKLSKKNTAATVSLAENRIKNVVIAEGVTWIDEEAFRGCYSTPVDMPNTVTWIGREVFKNCLNLISVNILK